MIIIELSRFSELFKQSEFTYVEFIARVVDIIKDSDSDERVIVKIFDGYDNDRFIVYGIAGIVEELIASNNVYKFKGIASGKKKRYFSLKGLEEQPITLKIEHKYFPERYRKPTNNMLYVYNVSIAKIKNRGLRRFVGQCLGLLCDDETTSSNQRNTYNRFINSPASLKYHDSYVGGFVAHIAGMLTIVDNIEENNCMYLHGRMTNDIDFDILRALVYLHDVGKPLIYYRQDNTFKWNDNYLENHAMVGSHYVYSVWHKTKLINLATMQKLCYGISTHMDTMKNINDNKVPEVRLLKAIDMLEANLADLF